MGAWQRWTWRQRSWRLRAWQRWIWRQRSWRLRTWRRGTRRRRTWRLRRLRRGVLATSRRAGYRANVRVVAVVNGNARRARGGVRDRLERVLPGGVRFTSSLEHARAVI